MEDPNPNMTLSAEDLLTDLVAAWDRLPREQRQVYFGIEAAANTFFTIHHPGLSNGLVTVDLYFYELEQNGFIKLMRDIPVPYGRYHYRFYYSLTTKGLRYVQEQQSLPRMAMSHSAMTVEPIWRGRKFPVEDDLCFVLMPFRDPLNEIYQDHIKPTVEGFGLRCQRADDIYNVNSIMEDVWEQVCRARVLVAELTERNPNVFYELGMAHTIGKNAILIAQNIEDVPFDLRHQRVIPYQYTPRGVGRLREALLRTLQRIATDDA